MVATHQGMGSDPDHAVAVKHGLFCGGPEGYDGFVMTMPMKLLIAYDGSSFADAALDDLARAGLPHEVEALVLSVADVLLLPETGAPDPSTPDWLVAAIEKSRARTAQAVEKAHALAVRASKRLKTEHPEWAVRAEACGASPAWAVIDKAQEWKADLVVVGSHGHSRIKGLLLGSVSQRVVSNVPCSVRIGRGPKGRKGVPVRVVIGYDGSPDAELALRAVAARAWLAGSAIRVVTAIDSLMSVALAFSSRDTATKNWLKENKADEFALVRRMNQVAAEKLVPTGLAVSSLVKKGNAKEILVKEAKRWKADCIFVGAKGLRGLERVLLGSVSMAVAARAHCSVEVVRTS